MCAEHLNRNTKQITAMLRKRLEQGLCRDCGKRPRMFGDATRCVICRAKDGHGPIPLKMRRVIRHFWRMDRIAQRREQVEHAISYLKDERQREILALRHGVRDGVDHTLEFVGQKFGVTRERIRQIEDKAYGILNGLGVDTSFKKATDWQRLPPTARKASKHERAKQKAHGLVSKAIREGRIKRQPCNVCGAKKAVAHHHDYNKPLEVQWLCRAHHAVAHGKKIGQPNKKAKRRYVFPAWLERALEDGVTSAHYDALFIVSTLREQQISQSEVSAATGISGLVLAKIVRGQKVRQRHIDAVMNYVRQLREKAA
jgi:hypothetical protein